MHVTEGQKWTQFAVAATGAADIKVGKVDGAWGYARKGKVCGGGYATAEAAANALVAAVKYGD